MPIQNPLFRSLGALALAAVVAFPAVSLAAAGGGNQCEVSHPDRHRMPAFTLGGLWGGAGGRTLMLIDPKRRSIQRFDRSGSALGRPSASSAADLDLFAPINARPLSDGGMVVEAPGGYYMQLGPDLLPVSDIFDVTKEAGLAGYFPYRWEITGSGLDDGGLVFCGEVKESEKADWRIGVFYLSLSDPSRGVTDLVTFDRRDPRRLGCRLGGQVFAVVHGEGETVGEAFVLLLDPQPQVYRIVPEAEAEKDRLVALDLEPRPEAMKVRPTLPTVVPASQYRELMKQVEGSKLAVELAGWKQHLYLLMRSPGEAGAPSLWSLARITPPSGTSGQARVETTRLDVDAPHVSMIPGPGRWAFVLKDTPRSLGAQDVLGLKLVDSGLLDRFGTSKTLCP